MRNEIKIESRNRTTFEASLRPGGSPFSLLSGLRLVVTVQLHLLYTDDEGGGKGAALYGTRWLCREGTAAAAAEEGSEEGSPEVGRSGVETQGGKKRWGKRKEGRRKGGVG
ncbi:hypothetical protein LINGRAHAP2_LOCUS11649 [Linum grandiflorum]